MYVNFIYLKVIFAFEQYLKYFLVVTCKNYYLSLSDALFIQIHIENLCNFYNPRETALVRLLLMLLSLLLLLLFWLLQ